MAERDHHRAGQGRQIDDDFRRIHFLRPSDRVAQHQPPLGIGVEHFDRLARHGGDDVAGAHRIAIGHVFDEADDADDVRLRLAPGDRLHRARNGARAAHVPFHHVHAGAGLQADPAGIKGHALADEHNRLVAIPAAVPAHGQQSRRPGRALRDAQQCAHAECFHLAFVEHFQFDTQIGQMLAALNEAFGIKDIRRLSHERLGQRDAIGDRFIHGPADRQVAMRRRDGQRLEARLGGVGQLGAVRVDPPVAQLGAHCERQHVVFIDHARAREIDMDCRRAAGLQPSGQRAARTLQIMHCAFADPDQQQTQDAAALDRCGFGDAPRRALKARLCRGAVQQRAMRLTERLDKGVQLALADRKRDDVGRRIDLRDKVNVHSVTLSCDD